MAAVSYGQTQGFDLPSWTYQNQEPFDIVGAIEKGIGLGNLVMQQPNLKRGREIQKMQQKQVLSGELPITQAQTNELGMVQGTMQDRPSYEADLAQQQALTQQRMAEAQKAQMEAATFGQPQPMSPIDEARLATEMAREQQIRQMMELRNLEAQQGMQPQQGIMPQVQMVEQQTGTDEQGNPIYEMVPQQTQPSSFWKETLPSGEEVTMMMGPGGRPVPYQPSADPFEQTMKRELAKTETKTLQEDSQGAQVAYDSLPKLYQIQQIVTSGQFDSGVGAEVVSNLRGFRTLAEKIIKQGRDVGIDETQINNQVMEAFMGQNVFPLIGALGIGARGLDTPPERKFLLEVFSGARTLEPETIKRITQIAIDMNERRVNRYNNSVTNGRYKAAEEILGRSMPTYDLLQIRPQGYTPDSISNPETSAAQPPQGLRNAPIAGSTGGGKIYIINGKPVKLKQ